VSLGSSTVIGGGVGGVPLPNPRDEGNPNNNSQFWTPKGYVNSFEEYKKTTSKKPDSLVGYSAYVTSINSEPYGSLLGKAGFLFGSNEKASSDDCGMLYRKIQCSKNSLHHPSFRHLHCNDPLCPICYTKYSSQMADRVVERLQGYRTVWRGDRNKLYHLIFWGTPQNKGKLYPSLAVSFKEANRLMGLMGVRAAVVWFHPYRIKAELKPVLRRYRTAKGLDGKIGFWKMAHDDVLGIGGLENYIVVGPHWHAIASGWLMDTKEYEEIEGAGYKKKRYLENGRSAYEVAYYVSTHCCREAMKSSVRYYGDLSYRMLAREHVETKIKDVVCGDCGSPLEEHDCDENGVCIQKLKDSITQKIKYYLYWKKGQPKPDMKDAWQCLISRFDRNIN
jgi:hypothetical protein